MREALALLIHQAFLFIPKLGASLLIFASFCLAATLSKNTILRLGKRSRLNQDVINLIAKVGQISLWIFGGVTALGTLGIDVSAIVAGLGITGLALSLALKDILSNLVAGVLILIYQPFRRHDWIEVEGVSGEVMEIDLRYTTLKTSDQRVLIPNSSLFNHTICVLEQPSSPLPPEG